ncbi:MAG TPA: hypothetical protein VM077_05835 [Candidatus Limnocylindrales bacterium]|nr:hypothetical protein [Candidatus Limnocylindrales bacterium]
MNKKLITVLVVIIAGFMLGTIITLTSKEKVKFPNSSSQQSPNPPKATSLKGVPEPPNSTELQVSAVAQPSKLKKNDQLPSDLTKAERTTIGISYKNTTKFEIKGIQVEVFTIRESSSKSPKYKTSSSKTAKINKEVTKTSKNPTYDVPDVKAGETGSATIFLYPLETGKLQIKAVVNVKDTKIKSTSRIVNLDVN